MAIDSAVIELSSHFKLRDLGPTSFLLGIGIICNPEKHQISLSQCQYIFDALERFNMSDCNPIGTPMDPGAHLLSSMSPQSPEEQKVMDKISYLSAVGTLQYLATSTHPDISFTVGVLACFNSNSGIQHWNAVKHLFCYLKGTLDYKLVYGPTDYPNYSSLTPMLTMVEIQIMVAQLVDMLLSLVVLQQTGAVVFNPLSLSQQLKLNTLQLLKLERR